MDIKIEKIEDKTIRQQRKKWSTQRVVSEYTLPSMVHSLIHIWSKNITLFIQLLSLYFLSILTSSMYILKVHHNY